MILAPSIPRFRGAPDIRDDPLAFLAAAQAAAGEIAVVAEAASVFSRAKACPGTVAVFGPQALQQVLSDADLFGITVSVGEHLALPPALGRLNAGLFSMSGDEHRTQQQALRAALNAEWLAAAGAMIPEALQAFAADFDGGADLPLLATLRRLVMSVSLRLVFGDIDMALGRLIQSYFEMRRALSSAPSPAPLAQRQTLIRTGGQLDRMLRTRFERLRGDAAARPEPQSLLGRLMTAGGRDGAALSEDRFVAQANTLFMSSSEPVAVSLAWILLLLTQRPALRHALRAELTATAAVSASAATSQQHGFSLLRGVIAEVLRLAPPNAIMVKLTTRPGRLLGHDLPAHCEILLSPFVAHRDPRHFADPDRADPERWRVLTPASFTYLPFGLGARYCVGRTLAHLMLETVLAFLLRRYDVVLAGDQELDWRINITLMPASDPAVAFQPLPAPQRRGGKLTGRAAVLLAC